MSDSEDDDVSEEPMTGDVVEYPLSDLVKADLQDGRERGVGLLVGRNKDRGDASKLPPELLGLCEIEPLRQEEADSTKSPLHIERLLTNRERLGGSQMRLDHQLSVNWRP